ncbi:unnamed protein product [Anisakis simplex]|uniref:Uncharacterized protein n=1 Tax=Anisakis simplex TaxID=6269 RepID=A0A0M3J0G2_ANISI|nr:unnamed protein product [Anisakis simplex]
MIPETGLLSQRCDEYSGIVERDGRQYCRYCDLCELSEKIENGLNRESGHEFLPEVVKGNEERFAPKCSKITTDTYQFKRTISLPGRRELTAKVRDQMQGLDGEIKKRLNKGRGRFQVFLNLISAQQPPLTHDQWFDSSSQCRCCGKHRDESCRSVLSFLYCDKEDCKSAWAQKCLHNSARIVACYTVEFNYRMTNSYDDVLQFLREKNLPNQDNIAKSLLTTQYFFLDISMKLFIEHDLRSIITATILKNSFYSTAPTKSLAGDGSLSARCVAEMPTRLVNLRRYCTIFWNQSLCCSHCEGIC